MTRGFEPFTAHLVRASPRRANFEEIKKSVKVCCCGVLYSTTDYDTWMCFERYKFKKPLKPYVAGEKIQKEIVYVLSCFKNNCTKVIINRYGCNSGKKIIDTDEISGKAGINFLNNYRQNLIKMPLKPPYKRIYSSKKIPAVYGKVVDFETQKRQYLDESGSPDNKILKAPYIRRFEG